jgi:hypothetical protein
VWWKCHCFSAHWQIFDHKIYHPDFEFTIQRHNLSLLVFDIGSRCSRCVSRECSNWQANSMRKTGPYRVISSSPVGRLVQKGRLGPWRLHFLLEAAAIICRPPPPPDWLLSRPCRLTCLSPRRLVWANDCCATFPAHCYNASSSLPSCAAHFTEPPKQPASRDARAFIVILEPRPRRRETLPQRAGKKEPSLRRSLSNHSFQFFPIAGDSSVPVTIREISSANG